MTCCKTLASVFVALPGDPRVDFLRLASSRPRIVPSERFDQFMAVATSVQEDLAEILNVRLQDRFGVDRQVELLRAKYLKLDRSSIKMMVVMQHAIQTITNPSSSK